MEKNDIVEYKVLSIIAYIQHIPKINSTDFSRFEIFTITECDEVS